MYEQYNNLLSLDVNDYDIYLRKSRKDMEFNIEESIEKTLERHEIQLQEYAKKLFGNTIPEDNIFREVVSGDTIEDRPQMQELLKRIESGNRKGVIVLEIERLARGNTIDQGIIAQAFQYSETKILTPLKVFDLNDEFDRTFFEDGLYQARKYLLYTKKILNRGRLQSVKEGKFVGSITPFGYSKEKLVNQKGYKLIPNEEAETVKLIFRLFTEDNIGTSNIANYLNSIGAEARKNDIWTPAMIRNILLNPVYCGKLTWNKRKTEKRLKDGVVIKSNPIHKEYTLVTGLHEAIISEEVWNMAQDKLKANSSKKVPNSKQMKNALAGLVKCGVCGRNMIRRPYDNGHKDTLICSLSKCKNVSSDLKIVEDKIIECLKLKYKQINYYLDNYEEECIKKTKDNTSIINTIQKEIQKLKKQYDKACEMLETDVYTPQVFQERTTSINTQIKAKENQIETLKKEMLDDKTIKYKKAIPNIENCINMYYKIETIEEKNKLLKSIIEKVIYKKEKGGRWDPEAIDKFEIDIILKF